MPRPDELPVDDYDHLQLGALLSRIRTLDAAGAQTLLGYERAHAHRLPVLRALESRVASLGATEPSGGEPAADSEVSG